MNSAPDKIFTNIEMQDEVAQRMLDAGLKVLEESGRLATKVDSSDVLLVRDIFAAMLEELLLEE